MSVLGSCLTYESIWCFTIALDDEEEVRILFYIAINKKKNE